MEKCPGLRDWYQGFCWGRRNLLLLAVPDSVALQCRFTQAGVCKVAHLRLPGTGNQFTTWLNGERYTLKGCWSGFGECLAGFTTTSPRRVLVGRLSEDCIVPENNILTAVVSFYFGACKFCFGTHTIFIYEKTLQLSATWSRANPTAISGEFRDICVGFLQKHMTPPVVHVTSKTWSWRKALHVTIH